MGKGDGRREQAFNHNGGVHTNFIFETVRGLRQGVIIAFKGF
jgi:hypothetical protein